MAKETKPEGAVVKAIPKAESSGAGVLCKTRKGQVYNITQNLAAKKFILWKQVSGGYEKIDQAATPIPLYEKIPWEK